MPTWISETTGQKMPVTCRPCVQHEDTRVAAVRLRAEWQSKSPDTDPLWVPVCWLHDTNWGIDSETGQTADPKHQPEPVDLTTWWVLIERSRSNSLAIGPYPDEEDAEHAMENALLIDGELEEHGEDCYVLPFTKDAVAKEYEIVLIDLDEPTYTGRNT